MTERENTYAPTPTGHPRMEWLDALRGFTMILVVAYHVSIQGFGETEKASSALPLLVLMRMPLFFFISGLLSYKADMNWTTGRLGMMIWKKVKIQVLPTIVFLFIALIMRYPHLWDAMVYAVTSPTKAGYWFTWVLLQMFIIYYVFSYFESKMKHKSWIPITILWVVALAAYAILYMPSWFTFPKPNVSSWLNTTSFIQTMRYFHFFILGNIVRRYWQRWQKLIDSRWFFPLLVVIVVLCCADIFKWHNLKFQWTNLPRTTVMYGLLLICFMTFRHYQDTFSHDTRIGRALSYIGVRTLDIYLIHFLLLPNLKMVGDFINVNKRNFVIDVTESVVVALLVIGFCIIISNILRVSPLFKKYLFGRK
ncbi:MAG: acyltransferase [Bacteroidaceae bacterium]|nr:acyltransferase [Bacteroidaceae bacterium]